MVKEYSEAEKIKYVQGFQKCTLTIRDYADKMVIDADELKKWLKEYKELPAFGVIDLSTPLVQENIEGRTNGMKFENDKIKIELKDGYEKEQLLKLIEVIMN